MAPLAGLANDALISINSGFSLYLGFSFISCDTSIVNETVSLMVRLPLINSIRISARALVEKKQQEGCYRKIAY